MANLKPFIFGAVVGAVAVPLLGFTALGWKFDSKAQALAHDAASAAVQKVLVPICVAQFKGDPDVVAHVTTLKAKRYAHPRMEFVRDGGWATLPGQSGPVSGLASSCARALNDAYSS